MGRTLPSDPAEHKAKPELPCPAAPWHNDSMAQESFSCYSCKTTLAIIGGRVGRGDTCDKCRNDVHVCRNCLHYDSTAYNECREPMAERVVDKEKRNFCDYFSPGATGKGAQDNKSDTLKKLDDLFK